jgi:hypothetical protein
MRMWPISTRVNKPGKDDPSIIEPIEFDYVGRVINRPPYGFGEVRVATLALLTFTVLSA